MAIERYNPTPVEIEERCEEIKSHWTDKERVRRLVHGTRSVMRCPCVHEDEDSVCEYTDDQT